MQSGSLVVVLLAAWITIGASVGVLLHQRGQPVATALSAVVAWPAMVGALGGSVGSGPYDAQIRAAFAALRGALADPVAAGLAEVAALDPIEASLRVADRRIAAVDRLLADPAVAQDEGAVRLRAARSRAGAEVEAVLKQLVTVRVQLGLVALAGDTESVRGHLLALAARARALEEVEV